MTALVGAGALAGIAGAAASGAFSGSDGPFTAENGPVPPAHSRWIRGDGRFAVQEYDDRQLPVEEKAKQPAYNPRWEPFSKCLASEGFAQGRIASRPFSQADLDRLLADVNSERPDASANRQLSSGQGVSGLAGAFLRCADTWLAIERKDLGKFGIRDLEPGETPSP